MLIGIIAGGIALIAGIVLIIYCIYKKKCKNPEDIVDTKIIKKIGEGPSESKAPIKTTSNNVLQKVKFTTGVGITQYVFIEPNKKIKDLIKEYFDQINQPELFEDKNMVILCCGNQINKSNYDQLISEFGKKNGSDGNLAFVVMDIQS